MKYIISNELPPIYERAKKEWGVDFDTTVFTYGNVIHTKRGLTPDLLAHELVHVEQQTKMGKDEWWADYFEDEDFRLDQELEAYKAQYNWVKENVPNREDRAKYLIHFCRALSGTMYGNMITPNKAKELIC